MSKNHKDLLLKSDLGERAKVSTEVVSGEMASMANALLKEIGMNLNKLDSTSEYIGSAAIHYYKPKGQVQYLHFQSQTSTMHQVPEEVADMGFTRLKGDLMEYYGRSRRTKRSGF